MPHDLFDDVVARPQSVRSRRSPFGSLLFVSLSAHAAVLGALVATSIVAPEALPFPEKVFAVELPVPVRLVDIPLPKPPRPREPQPPTTQQNTYAPVPDQEPIVEPPAPPDAPPELSPETGREPGNGAGVRGSVAPPTPPAEPVAGSGLPATEPVKSPAATAPVRLHSGIQAPRKVSDAVPVYPALAREAHVQGVVIIEATIDSSGNVAAVQVLRSIPLLDEAALNAVRQWRFEPARLNGQAVSVIMTVTVNFTLGR